MRAYAQSTEHARMPHIAYLMLQNPISTVELADVQTTTDGDFDDVGAEIYPSWVRIDDDTSRRQVAHDTATESVERE